MAEIIIYTTEICPYCQRAKAFLDSKGLKYQEIKVDNDLKLRQEMEAKSQRRTVPQIFINGQSIGGCDDLLALAKAGKLDALLKA